jgi:hypothetical protein
MYKPSRIVIAVEISIGEYGVVYTIITNNVTPIKKARNLLDFQGANLSLIILI